MATIINAIDINKELGLNVDINYRNLNVLHYFIGNNKLPLPYFKREDVWTEPKETFYERLLDKLGNGNKLKLSNMTIILKEVVSVVGFTYCSVFIFHTNDVDAVKKAYSLFKLRVFI